MNGNIKEQMEAARAKANEEAVAKANNSFAGQDPFSSFDFDEADKVVEENAQAEESKSIEISYAQDVAKELAKLISGPAHFRVAKPEYKEVFDDHPVAGKTHRENIALLRLHSTDGNVDKVFCEELQRYVFLQKGVARSHCTIPSRLSALDVFIALTLPRKVQKHDLRPLRIDEVTEIARESGVVVEASVKAEEELKVGNRSLRIGTKHFVLAKNDQATIEEKAEFEGIIAKIRNNVKEVVEEERENLARSLEEQETSKTIDEAISVGGAYLAVIPSGTRRLKDNTIEELPGGRVILFFDGNGVTVGVKGETEFADGPFQRFVENNLYNKQRVTLKEVEDAFDAVEKYGKDVFDKVRFRGLLWSIIVRHLILLKQEREKAEKKRKEAEKEVEERVKKQADIDRMVRDDDLSVEQFLAGELGSIVLSIDYFNIKGPPPKTISPAGIRITRSVIVQNKQPISAVHLEECCSELVSFVNYALGSDKIFPEDNIPGMLGKFFFVWNKFYAEKPENNDNDGSDDSVAVSETVISAEE